VEPIGTGQTDLPEVEEFFARMERRRRRNLILLFAVPTLLLTGAIAWDRHEERVKGWARGELDIRGQRVFTPPHPSAPRPDTGAMRWLHVQSLPTWIIALNQSPEAAGHHMDRTLARLKDPNMRHLLRRLQRLVRQDMVANARRIFYLVWAWNSYLDSHDLPWRLDASIRAHPRRMLLMRSYRVVHDLRVTVGSRDHRSRLLQRVDQTNIVDNYFGFTEQGDQGSFVVLDNIHSFVSDHVWPLLASGPDFVARDELQRRFAPDLRREARTQLDSTHHATLRQEAPARSTLVAAVRAINDRHRCGSDMGLSFVPFNGFSRSWQRRFYNLAIQGASDPCPAVTAAEFVDLTLASQRLRQRDGLAPAVRALTAWFARGISAHESRHMADELGSGAGLGGPSCQGCPDDLGPLARAELSAFLASFSLPGSGYLHLYQACITAQRAPHHSHGRAVTFASRSLDDACENGPPRGLYRRAAALRRRLFGAHEPVTLPRDFPRDVPLPWWAE